MLLLFSVSSWFCGVDCVTNFYRDGNTCQRCPDESNSLGGAVSNCMCAAGLATSTGSVTTTTDPCSSCLADYYRMGEECIMCPPGSSRNFEQEESLCFCSNNGATSQGSTNTTSDGCTGIYEGN